MFRYRLHSAAGDDLGEATYAMMIQPGEEIHGDGGQRLRVLAVVPFSEEDESVRRDATRRACLGHRVPSWTSHLSAKTSWSRRRSPTK